MFKLRVAGCIKSRVIDSGPVPDFVSGRERAL